MSRKAAWYDTCWGRARAERELEASLKRYFSIGLVLLTAGVLLASAASAYGYYYESLPATTPAELIPDCIACHGIPVPSGVDAGGPHGGYPTTTNECAVCHSLHNVTAPGMLLLPGATVKANCETCHDGTGGAGVYGVLKMRDVETSATHSVESTNAVPGGDPSSGATITATFRGLSGTLTCTDCHSPHGTDVVAPFTGDRDRRGAQSPSVEITVTSSRLLKRRPTTATQTVDVYGSDWCGGCHQGRLSGSGVWANHPVESTITASGIQPRFWYGMVARVAGVGGSATELGPLGRNNFGYVMPDGLSVESTRSPEQTGHYPICQQCHEDARSVGDTTPRQISADEIFAVNVNPEFQTFPHESPNASFLIEPVDRLCLNCHLPK